MNEMERYLKIMTDKAYFPFRLRMMAICMSVLKINKTSTLVR